MTFVTSCTFLLWYNWMDSDNTRQINNLKCIFSNMKGITTMGYRISVNEFNSLIEKFSDEYLFYAPKLLKGKGTFSDTDLVRYEEISNVAEIETKIKSRFSYKEVLLPMSQTLFYYTEDNVSVPAQRNKKAIVFIRSCDIHALKRLDEIYLKNGFEDKYYKDLRDNTKFALIGCSSSFENCFCVSMGTNITKDYDFSFDIVDDTILIDSNWSELDDLLCNLAIEQLEVEPSVVTTNDISVVTPETESIDTSVFESEMWEQYNSRCISCGRCNFVCPTCTCFTMQDIFYDDNKNTGERRRVWASCHVDGYTDMAGGHGFRTKKSERMRFKVLHKVYDYKKRYGYHMCVGCGRCDDACPEYISFSEAVNNLTKFTKGDK